MELAQSRILLVLITIIVTLGFSSLSSSTQPHETRINVHDISAIKATPSGAHAQQKLLILTPLKDAESYLDEYFLNLRRLNYPPNLISLAFLVSDSTDNTHSKLKKISNNLKQLNPKQRFESITIFTKDFHFDLSSAARHGFEGQPVRRAFIARARNYLLSSALQWDHSWVLWLDVDVVRYDPDILSDMMKTDKDIVVPNTLWHLEKEKVWDFWVSPLHSSFLPIRSSCCILQGFDRNNFAETEVSLALLKELGPDILLVEGQSFVSSSLMRLLHLRHRCWLMRYDVRQDTANSQRIDFIS